MGPKIRSQNTDNSQVDGFSGYGINTIIYNKIEMIFTFIFNLYFN
jgi:hypothetical protein